jgi:hypothetical protein
MATYKQQRLRFLTGIIILGFCSFPAQTHGFTFDLQGRVPSSITADFLAPAYSRILRSVSPPGAVDTAPITIIYYGRSDERKLGVRLPEWGGGGAIGRDTVIIPVDKSLVADMALDRVTLHELVHIALERQYGRLRLPRWLHEGMAMTLSGELSFEEQAALSRAVFAHRLLPLDSIERVNRFDAYGAALAYSQSHLAVSFIIETWGMDALPELLAAVRKTGAFDAALMAVFGLTPQEFERLVNDHITARYRYLFLIGDTWLYWLPGALLVVVGFIAVRLRNKKRLAQMEIEERENRLPVLSATPDKQEDEGDCPEDDEELNEDGTEPDDDDDPDRDEEDRDTRKQL